MITAKIASKSILKEEGKIAVSRLFLEKEVVVLVGSKVSEWPSTNLPSGMNTSAQVAELLAEQLPTVDLRKRLIYYFSRAPFEYILDQCPRMDLLRPFFRDLFDNSNSNPVHAAIANLVHQGRVHSLITPNYDYCFENLIRDRVPLTHVVEEDEARSQQPSSRVLFKIHGTASKRYEHTMVLQLSQEGLLPEWKQDVLRKVLRGRVLLTLGFSGLDFEISPYILTSSYEYLVWNSYRDPATNADALSPNARRLLKNSRSEVIWGDMLKILEELGQRVAFPSGGDGVKDIRTSISQMLSTDDKLLWASQILASPGYAKFAELFSKTLKNNTQHNSKYYSKALRLIAAANFSKGKYINSSKLASEASRLFLLQSEYADYLLSEALVVDSLRCAGRQADAVKRLFRAKESAISFDKVYTPRLKAKLELQELLLVREEYEHIQILLSLGFSNQISTGEELLNRAKILMTTIVQVAYSGGQWHDIQQCRMWAERMGINFRDIYSGPLEPLENIEGWKHLGHIIQEMMSLRDSLFNKKYHEAPEILVRDYLEKAKELECNPEIWKLTLSLYKHYGHIGVREQFNWVKAFITCQYTLKMRFFKLFAERYR